MNTQSLSLYLTAEHSCGYYADRNSANIIPDPQIQMNKNLYSFLVSKGFRRSGNFVYRPHCPACQACIACRIKVSGFQPNRNQRRCLKKNRDLITRITPACYTEEYFDLYRRYLNVRHHDGSMANPEPNDFQQFLLCDWRQSLFIESRVANRLICVTVADHLADGLSAVYTFFDPDENKRSLGTHAILQQIWFTQIYQLPHVYLGYWIRNHPKMNYKNNFQSLQLYQENQWVSNKSLIMSS
ncbi:MAG: arginyltransferase [Gammaproteobacteria bacterium]|nr:arginyltransferase [Gammaproteobacteria bacterium]